MATHLEAVDASLQDGENGAPVLLGRTTSPSDAAKDKFYEPLVRKEVELLSQVDDERVSEVLHRLNTIRDLAGNAQVLRQKENQEQNIRSVVLTHLHTLLLEEAEFNPVAVQQRSVVALLQGIGFEHAEVLLYSPDQAIRKCSFGPSIELRDAIKNVNRYAARLQVKAEMLSLLFGNLSTPQLQEVVSKGNEYLTFKHTTYQLRQVEESVTGGDSFNLVKNASGVAVHARQRCLLVTDSSCHCIWRIYTDRFTELGGQEIEVFAGSPHRPGDSDGTLATARFNCPSGIAICEDSQMAYVCDTGNNIIRSLDLEQGTVRTLTLRLDDEAASACGSASFSRPKGVCCIVGSEHWLASMEAMQKQSWQTYRSLLATELCTANQQHQCARSERSSGSLWSGSSEGSNESSRSGSALSDVSHSSEGQANSSGGSRSGSDVDTSSHSRSSSGSGSGSAFSSLSDSCRRRRRPAEQKPKTARQSGLTRSSSCSSGASGFSESSSSSSSGFGSTSSDSSRNGGRRAGSSGRRKRNRRGKRGKLGKQCRQDAPGDAAQETLLARVLERSRLEPRAKYSVFHAFAEQLLAKPDAAGSEGARVSTACHGFEVRGKAAAAVASKAAALRSPRHDSVDLPGGGTTTAKPRFTSLQKCGDARDTTLRLAVTCDHCVWFLDPETGETGLLAGSSAQYGYCDASFGMAARFSSPKGLICIGSVLFVADYWNNVVRSINLFTTEVETVVDLRAEGPTAMCVSSCGVLYVLDSEGILQMNALSIRTEAAEGDWAAEHMMAAMVHTAQPGGTTSNQYKVGGQHRKSDTSECSKETEVWDSIRRRSVAADSSNPLSQEFRNRLQAHLHEAAQTQRCTQSQAKKSKGRKRSRKTSRRASHRKKGKPSKSKLSKKRAKKPQPFKTTPLQFTVSHADVSHLLPPPCKDGEAPREGHSACELGGRSRAEEPSQQSEETTDIDSNASTVASKTQQFQQQATLASAAQPPAMWHPAQAAGALPPHSGRKSLSVPNLAPGTRLALSHPRTPARCRTPVNATDACSAAQLTNAISQLASRRCSEAAPLTLSDLGIAGARYSRSPSFSMAVDLPPPTRATGGSLAAMAQTRVLPVSEQVSGAARAASGGLIAPVAIHGFANESASSSWRGLTGAPSGAAGIPRSGDARLQAAEPALMKVCGGKTLYLSPVDGQWTEQRVLAASVGASRRGSAGSVDGQSSMRATAAACSEELRLLGSDESGEVVAIVDLSKIRDEIFAGPQDNYSRRSSVMDFSRRESGVGMFLPSRRGSQFSRRGSSLDIFFAASRRGSVAVVPGRQSRRESLQPQLPVVSPMPSLDAAHGVLGDRRLSVDRRLSITDRRGSFVDPLTPQDRRSSLSGTLGIERRASVGLLGSNTLAPPSFSGNSLLGGRRRSSSGFKVFDRRESIGQGAQRRGSLPDAALPSSTWRRGSQCGGGLMLMPTVEDGCEEGDEDQSSREEGTIEEGDEEDKSSDSSASTDSSPEAEDAGSEGEGEVIDEEKDNPEASAENDEGSCRSSSFGGADTQPGPALLLPTSQENEPGVEEEGSAKEVEAGGPVGFASSQENQAAAGPGELDMTTAASDSAIGLGVSSRASSLACSSLELAKTLERGPAAAAAVPKLHLQEDMMNDIAPDAAAKSPQSPLGGTPTILTLSALPFTRDIDAENLLAVASTSGLSPSVASASEAAAFSTMASQADTRQNGGAQSPTQLPHRRRTTLLSSCAGNTVTDYKAVAAQLGSGSNSSACKRWQRIPLPEPLSCALRGDKASMRKYPNTPLSIACFEQQDAYSIYVGLANAPNLVKVLPPKHHEPDRLGRFNALPIDPRRLLLADETSHQIWLISLFPSKTGKIIAGSGKPGHLDGPLEICRMQWPCSMALNPHTQDIYVADRGNHMIRKIDLAAGLMSTIAGSGVRGNRDGADQKRQALDSPFEVSFSEPHFLMVSCADNSVRSLNLQTGFLQTLLVGS
eukprot:TRINITY_DN15202_c0_g1_i1.p1 TRINITY_DN15202_c0_g1~~TRINITY_DN15202_c0_g1_i1.p1  ORF type:complete len:1976 (-),score=399.02 TRINITY_DN15202_c0_g1_i1:74-6001(-)